LVLYGDGGNTQVWMGQVIQCEIAEDSLHHLRLILEQLSSQELHQNNLIHFRENKSRNWYNTCT